VAGDLRLYDASCPTDLENDMEQIQKMLTGYTCPHCGKSGLMKFTTIGGDFVADGPNEETGEMIRHVCETLGDPQ
jgi:hypothetical protein